MTISKAHDLSLALDARLKQISIANGYQTDVGLNTFRGKLRLSPEEVPFTVLLEGDDSVEGRTRKTAKLGQRYTAEAHATCENPDQPNDTAHKILADLKKAIFNGDHTFDRRVIEIAYIGRAIGAREDGSDVAFASVTFELVFAEDLTSP